MTPGLTDFLTLTYPGVILDKDENGKTVAFDEIPDPWTAKKHLFKFWKILRYHYPGIAARWRMEPQKRLAPHFHLLIWNAPYIEREKLQDWWQEARGSEHAAWVWITALLSMREALGYIAKYMAKTETLLGTEGEPASATGSAEGVPGGEAAGSLENSEKLEKTKRGWSNPGRFWGVLDRRYLPVAPAQPPLDLPQGNWQKAMIRAVRKFRQVEEERIVREKNRKEQKRAARRRSHRITCWWVFEKDKFKRKVAYLRPDRGFTVFTSNTEQWADLALYLVDEGWQKDEEREYRAAIAPKRPDTLVVDVESLKAWKETHFAPHQAGASDANYQANLIEAGMDAKEAYDWVVRSCTGPQWKEVNIRWNA